MGFDNLMPTCTRRALLVALCAPAVVAARAPVELGDPCRPAVDQAPPFTATYGDAVAFVASVHAAGSDSPVFAEVRSVIAWRPALLILEGVPTASGLNPPGLMSRAQAQRSSGVYASEVFYAAAQADRAGISVIGAQPSEVAIVRAQREAGYPPRDILGARVLSDLRGTLMLTPAGDRLRAAREMSARALAAVGADLGLSDFDVAAWYRERFGVALEQDPQLLQRGTPCGGDPASRIVAVATRVRNEHLLRLIDDWRAREARVAAVMGAGHFFALAGPLEARYGPPAIRSGGRKPELVRTTGVRGWESRHD